MIPADLAKLELEYLGFGRKPIHLMVPETKYRVSKTFYKYSIFTGALPKGAFRKLNDHVFIASPEFCTIQAALAYTPVRLIELCMELCGTYSLVPEEDYGFTTHNDQLSSVDSLLSFVKPMRRIQGANRVMSAIRFLQDGARSPMETREYLLFCLPKHRGGYGLPKAELNYQIDLDEEKQNIAGRKYFVCDMCWPERKVVVEYDGDRDHSSREARSNDAIKKNMLTNMGYTVFTITANEINDIEKTKQIVKSIAKSLNHRLQGLPKDWNDRHRHLRKELFKSMFTE